ncbi:mastermind-like protein 1 isoform X2 [Sphaeramia orbicularis]|nr:mastermind-like protein 1 isoform X2 [Sphaeramia orbicularis]
MERLRRRIELFRQHHNTCESRYENATLERLELERQQTFALHQRCLQAKAKRSNKHRQPQASGDQAGQRAPGGGGGGGAGGGGAELGESGGMAAEQSRNSTLIALQETVKRKLESASSPLGRDQVNGFSDGFPPNKKPCLDNGTANGSPLDSKLGVSDALNANGTHGTSAESTDGGVEPGSDFHRKEMKQEPDDILPIMPPSGGGNNNSLFPDLNLNEQEWTELMEELNCSVPYEDIQDILNDGFEDRKDPLDMAPTPGGAEGVGGGAASGGRPSSQGLLPPDLANVKAEFSPASAFEQDSRTGSPHVRSTPSGPPPPHPTSSPIASSSASSPALPPSQPAPPPRQLQPPPNHLLAPGPPGPPVPKDLSPAQQLQQLAAQQQRAQQQQHLHSQLQHKPPQPGAKFHSQGPHAHPPPWPQMANTSQSPLGGAFGMDKPTSPSLYPQDFNPNAAQKQLLMPGQPNKGSPKAGPGGYMQGPSGHPNMLGHPGPPLSHPQAPGAPAPAAMLNYNNTKPLSHFDSGGPGPGPPRPPNTQSQNKAALLSLLRQQQQQQIKQKNSMNFRPHIPHTQDQNSYPAPPHGPGAANSMPSAPGSNAMAAQPGANAMAGNHGNAAYLSNQAAVAAALKQQQQQQQQRQILEQQKQQQYIQQRQQLMEQEKQRQQDQQLKRHLSRPPPQYQDQPGQPANQNPFPQPPVNQFTASSQPMGNVGSMGGPAPGSRMFPQTQGMMGMNMGQGGGPAAGVAPPSAAASQADLSLQSCGGGGGGGSGVDIQQVIYNNMNLHPNHPAHTAQQAGLQRQPMGPMSGAPYRQQLLQQQHLKSQPNAAMLKQQQLAAAAARMPSTMSNSMNAAWQQPPSSNTGMAPFNNQPFHMQQQQPRIPKMAPGGAPFNPNGRPMAAMNQQQMMQANMAQQRAPPNAQQQQAANQNQAVLPDLAAFGQPPQGGSGRPGMQCNQGYQVSRTANQQQQQLSCGYNVASGSFAEESELVDSLLKGQSTQEWMDDLDELLASHH